MVDNNMKSFKEIDLKIQQGYYHEYRGNSTEAVEIWLEAWQEIKELLKVRTSISNFHNLEKKYSWSEFILNYIQDLQMALENAGLDDDKYNHQMIAYCNEIMPYLTTQDSLAIENTKRYIAEAYFRLGDIKQAERLYEQWLAQDPKWGWGYVGLADMYGFGFREQPKNVPKAIAIIDNALEIKGLRDRDDVMTRLDDYKE